MPQKGGNRVTDKMKILHHQRQKMNEYGYLMSDEARAWNENRLRMLEAEALEEIRKEFIQSAQDEMAKANSENAKQFAGEVDKAFKKLGLK